MDELIALITSIHGDSDEAKKLIAVVKAEDEKNTNGLKLANEKVDGLNTNLKNIGYDPAKHSNFDVFRNEITEKLNKGKDAQGKVLTSEERITNLEGQLTTMTSEKAEATKNALNLTVRKDLSKSIGGRFGSHSESFVIDSIISNNEVNSSEGKITVGGKSVGDFMASFVDENKNLIVSPQKSGTEEREILESNPNDPGDFITLKAKELGLQ
jgi:hypothetical protein